MTKPIGYHLNEMRKNKLIKLSLLLDYINISNSSWYRYVKGETDITTLQFLHTVRYLRTTFSEVSHMKSVADNHLKLYDIPSYLPAKINYQIPLREFYITYNIERLKMAVKLYRLTSSSSFNNDLPLDLKKALKSVLLEGEYGLEEINLLVLLKLEFNNVLFHESEFINILHNLIATIKRSIDITTSIGDLSAAQQNVIFFNQSLGLRFAFSALTSINSEHKASQYAPLLFQVIQLNDQVEYPSWSLYNFASKKLLAISELYLLDKPTYSSEINDFRHALITLYPSKTHADLESINYDLLKNNIFETTVSTEMKKAYQQYVDKLENQF
ncbi:hypothetical protein [Leuconostoc gelidum]|uniref:hypothetical protein n=1 Tax=Leuconostoc gelidum TaxID=1244 RepID=UPI001CC54134|nr:hypothetical protein [Leuconostoc gelidum]